VDGAEVVLLLVAGVVAGVAGSVAGLASLVSYPALLAAGLPALTANVTNTVALVLYAVSAAAFSRRELAGQAGRLRRLASVTAVGGAAGAALLLSTPEEVFEFLVPLLIGGASLLQPGIRRLTRGAVHERSPALLAGVFAVGLYGGYFGAAAGVVLLALLTVSVAEPLARLVAARNVAMGLANLVAAVSFALFGPVRWAAAAPLAAGFLIGGSLGPGLVRRLPGDRLRVGIALLGLGLAVKLGFDTFGQAGGPG
jgi:uncharacterized membrane protein YfcA